MQTPLKPSDLPTEWRQLNTERLTDTIYEEILKRTSVEGLPNGEVFRSARHDALTIANNIKYGPESNYIDHRLKVHPIRSPHFSEALNRVALRPAATIVDMGVNDAFEIGAIAEWGGGIDVLNNCTVWGIDIADEAIKKARARYPGERFHFLHGNGETLEGRNAKGLLDKIPNKTADLYLSINSFQSSGLNKTLAFESALRVLKDDGAIMLVVPPFHDPGTGAENMMRKAVAVEEICALFDERRFRVEILGEGDRYTSILGMAV